MNRLKLASFFFLMFLAGSFLLRTVLQGEPVTSSTVISVLCVGAISTAIFVVLMSKLGK